MKVKIGNKELTCIESVSLTLRRVIDEGGRWVGTAAPLSVVVRRAPTNATDNATEPLNELLALGVPSEVEVTFAAADGADVLTFDLKDVFIQLCGYEAEHNQNAGEEIVMNVGGATMKKSRETAAATFAYDPALYDTEEKEA